MIRSSFIKYWFNSVFCFVLILASCNTNRNKAEEIIRNSGNNKIELNKVIEHYKLLKDEEKLKAAYFLIGNMKDKNGRYGNIVQAYFPVFETLNQLCINKIDPDTINKFIEKEWNSIEQKSGPITNNNYQLFNDYQVITADYLIENIDYAFKAWKEKPWAAHLNFYQFCEFVLPYRLLDEPLQFYRKDFYNEFSWVEDSLKDKSNPLEVCQIINDYVARKFNFCSKLDKCPLLGAADMNKLKGGICEHRYLLVASILRSIGVPICLDFTPQFNNNAIGHSWISTIDRNNKFVAFNGGEPGIIVTDEVKFPIIGVAGATKIFRNYFEEKHSEMSEDDFESLDPSFKNNNIKDVTYQYSFPQMDVEFELQENINSKFVYLFSFGYGLNFVPTYYSKPSSGQVYFKNVGSNCVYFIADKNNNQLKILSNPVYLHNDSIVKLNPDFSDKHEIKLTRKFLPAEYIYKMYHYASSLKGAKFQASNQKDFQNATTIYEIDSKQHLSYTEKEVKLDNSYRFYRFISSDTGAIRIAELGFICDEAKATSIFGYCAKNKSEPNTSIFTNAFDYNISTNLNAPAGSWVAVDFNKPVKVNKLYFLIRNDLNAVEIGNSYELFYFNYGWISLGVQIAQNFSLTYKNVPSNALLLLRNLTKGKEERIFMYKNGEQIWL